jgi:hypothetical protein
MVKKGAPGVKILAVLFLLSGIIWLSFFGLWLTHQNEYYDPLDKKFQERVMSRFPDASKEYLDMMKTKFSSEEAIRLSRLNAEMFKSNMAKLSMLYSCISCIELVVLGVGLLGRWEFARKATIVLSVLNVVADTFVRTLSARNSAIIIEKYYPGSGKIIMEAMPGKMLLSFISYALLAAVFIWYLSRRHVKEAFCRLPAKSVRG